MAFAALTVMNPNLDNATRERSSTARKITVTTQGPKQWSVVAKNLTAAKQVKGQLEEDGLDCSSIEQRTKGYAFRVDASSVISN